MRDPLPTDENLKNRVIEQALAGDNMGARETARGIADRECLRQAWLAMLGLQIAGMWKV